MADPSSSAVATFLPGLDAEYVLGRLRAAGGNEVTSGKLASPESSAALAVNTFGWFAPRPRLLPALPGLSHAGSAIRVDVEYCARFPWPGGRHPWLDAIVETATHLIGVESKRYEPYRDRKTVSLSDAYDQPVWGPAMVGYERMRDDLRSGAMRFDYLDAAQLVKHAFGLVTDARRRSRKPILFYLFAEPEALAGRPLPAAVFEKHREEVLRFSSAVQGCEVEFAAASYREWLASWSTAGEQVSGHAERVLTAFHP